MNGWKGRTMARTSNAHTPAPEVDPADSFDVKHAKTVRRGARPRRVTLALLRKAIGLTQVEVAQAMQVDQAAISKLEGRSDALVSTLRAYARALGGELELAVVRGDRRYPIVLDEEGEQGTGR